MRHSMLLVVLLAPLAAASCTDRREVQATPRSAELSIGYAESRPRAARQRGIDTIINTLTSERLLQLARDGRPEPGLAHEWQVGDDGLTYRFDLRQGLTLHDGSPLTPAVVVESLKRVVGGRSVTPGMRDIASIEEAGPTSFVIRLKRPNSFLLEDLNFFPLQGGKDGAQRAGPFRLIAKSEADATLEAFPAYHRGRPKLGQIRIQEFPSPRTAWGAMLRGEIDFLYDVGPEALEFVEQSPTTFVATFLRPYATALIFNIDHPVLRRAEVRRALNLAVNRAGIIKEALNGRGFPASDHVWPRHWAYDQSVPAFEPDAAAAMSLLDGEGLRPKATRVGAAGTRFAFTCVVVDEPRLERVALLVQRELAAIGVDMKLELLSEPDFMKRMVAGTADAFLNEFVSGQGLNFVQYVWRSPGALFKSSYKGADVALDQVRDARTDDQRRAAVGALQRAFRSDPPGIFIYWSETTRAVSRRFIVPRQQDRDIFSTVSQWRAANASSE